MTEMRRPALSPLQHEIMMLLAQDQREHLSAILNHIHARKSSLSQDAVLLDAAKALSGLSKLGYIDCDYDLKRLKRSHFESDGLGIFLSLSGTGRLTLDL
jgi:hypothetical protein